MSGREIHGTRDDIRRLVEATGDDRERLIRERFGDWSTTTQTDAGMRQTPSGLIVPPSAMAAVDPFDQISVYLTTEDIFGEGHTLSPRSIVELVQQVSLEAVVSWCADWVAKLHRPGLSQQQVDAQFIDAYIGGPHRTRIENLLRAPHSVLLATQTFIVITKIALEHNRRGVEPPITEDLRPLVTAALALPSHLASDVEGIAEDDLVIGADAGPIGAYLVANQMFNNASNWQSAWSIYQRCVRELPHELKNHPQVLDFEVAYLDATGVPIDDLVTVCAVVWARAIGGGPTMPISHFDALRWEPSRLAAVLDLVSAAPESLREHLREDAGELGLIWSTKTFDRYPIVRWKDHLTVLHPGWVVNRSTGLWPLLDVRRELGVVGQPSRASKVATSVEHVYEHYALETLSGIVGQDRTYNDTQLRRAYGRRGQVADAVIDYGTSWVVVEVTTRGFQLKTAAGTSEGALAQDIDDIIRKARQTQATIDNLRDDETALTGRPSTGVQPRFYPVVIVASRFAGNPLTFTMLRTRLEAEGVLQADDCAPLEVLQLDDLLAMEGTIEEYGVGFLDLLAEKSAIDRPLVPMIEFLAHKLRRNAPFPARVQRSWKSWIATAMDQLREPGHPDEK